MFSRQRRCGNWFVSERQAHVFCMDSRKHDMVTEESFIVEREKNDFLYPLCNWRLLIFGNKIKWDVDQVRGQAICVEHQLCLLVAV